MIKKGDKVKINNTLKSEMKKLGFDDNIINTFCKRFVNTEQTVYTVWNDDDGQAYATIDMCCEVPIQCCDLINEE